MASLRQREEAKGYVDRYRHPLKFRVARPGDRKFLIDELHLVGTESKVRGIQVTGRKDPPGSVILIRRYLFHFLRMDEHFPGVRVGMLSDPFLGLDIIDNRVGLH